jgi:hypothetical protein
MLERERLEDDLSVPERRATAAGGGVMQTIIGCLIAVAFGVVVASQFGGEG